MKRFIYAAFAIVLTACTADFQEVEFTDLTASTDKVINRSDNSIQGSVIVRFDPSAESRLAEGVTRSGATRSGIAEVDAVLDKVGGYSVEQLFVVTEKNREKIYDMGMHLWYVVKFDQSHSLDSVAAELAKVGEVKYIEFVKTVKRVSPAKPVIAERNADIGIDQTRAATSGIPFNDSYASYLWGLENLGKDSKVEYSSLFEPVVEADVNAVSAWRLCKGDPSIIVAIIDEGVMYTHEDLADNYLINTAELNGVAGKDDDGNGYKDDIYGWNFVSSSKSISWDKNGDSGHGCHVAGIISAVNNNGVGVCSIAGGSGNNDGVKVFSSQIFSGNSGATTTNTARAIQYAADRGAHILQCSWGYDGGDITSDTEFRYYISAEANAIDYFIKYGGGDNSTIEGGLAIFAAGNEMYAMSSYPAAYEPCISVAAYGPSLKPAYYTNYSYGTDIVAPGGDALYGWGQILSTVPSKFATNGTKNYAMMQGTSMACPMVSGVAALGLSYAKKLGKRYTSAQFRSMLLSATNDMSDFLSGNITLEFTDGSVETIHYPNYKGELGAGAIDAYKLLLQIDGTPHSVIKSGELCTIDLAPYFGQSVAEATLSEISISDSDKAAVALSTCKYNKGTLQVQCNKQGIATLSVTLIVGNGSISDTKHPNPTTITKKFVLFVRNTTSNNGGWL